MIKDIEKIIVKYLHQCRITDKDVSGSKIMSFSKDSDWCELVANDIATQLQEMIDQTTIPKSVVDREYVPKEEMQELLLNPKKYFFMCQSEVDTNYIPKSQAIERLRFYLNKLCWEERDVQALLDTVLKKLDDTIEADQPKWYKDVKK